MPYEPRIDYRDSHTGKDRGKLYDARYREGADAFYWNLIECPLVVSLFRKLSVRHGKCYLDVACGTGRILEIATPAFDSVTGVDVSESMLAEARRKVPSAKLLQMDIAAEGQDLGRFDVISLFRFLLNAEPELRDGVLSWISRSLSENGVLIINNHLNSASLLGLAVRLRNRQLGTRRHNVLSDREVHSVMAKHGFKIVKSIGFGFLPAFRGKLILPRMLLQYIEPFLMAIPFLQRFGKDRIYICLLSNSASARLNTR
jgi:SAM-dependent methyltransferase